MSRSSSSVVRQFQEIGPWAVGRSLREALAEGERPDRAALVDWGGQLLETLAEAHAEGLLHRHLTEDEVFLVPEGRLLLFGFAPPEPGDPHTVQSDLYAAGCLLRRLAFAASLRGGRRRLGPRDPLVKVLARATFANPAARYESAVEMAAALREAGRAVVASGPRPLDRPRGTDSRVAEFSPRRPAASREGRNPEDRELWHALVLLVASLLLMALVLTAGWVLLARPGGKEKTRADHSPGPSPSTDFQSSSKVQKKLSLPQRQDFKRDLQVESGPSLRRHPLLPSGAALGGV